MVPYMSFVRVTSYSSSISTPFPEKMCACIGCYLQIKKPNLEDAVVGAFMAGADFVPPKKKKHEPLIKFLGKRAVLREQVPPMHNYIFCAFPCPMFFVLFRNVWCSWSMFFGFEASWNTVIVHGVLLLFGPALKRSKILDGRSIEMVQLFWSPGLVIGYLLNRHRFCLKYVSAPKSPTRHLLLSSCRRPMRVPSPDPSKQMASENAAPAEPTRHRHSPGALDFSQIVGGASFGRPVMTDEEMDAINSGGAECAPQVCIFVAE